MDGDRTRSVPDDNLQAIGPFPPKYEDGSGERVEIECRLPDCGRAIHPLARIYRLIGEIYPEISGW